MKRFAGFCFNCLCFAFISHYVQMKRSLIVRAIALIVSFISHYVQMKRSGKGCRRGSPICFISHYVQMKLGRSYNADHRVYPLYPTTFR